MNHATHCRMTGCTYNVGPVGGPDRPCGRPVVALVYQRTSLVAEVCHRHRGVVESAARVSRATGAHPVPRIVEVPAHA